MAAITACASPTLPLPPPAQPLASEGTTAGTVHLAAGPGSAEANATIVIINHNPSIPDDHNVGGATVENDGSWQTDIYGGNGDAITITQQFGNTTSTPLTFTLRIP